MPLLSYAERLGLALQYQERVAKQRREAPQIPFLDDAPMLGPPSCTAVDFKQPRLRRCPFDLEDMVIEARLGGGADGYVWKVRFGDEHGPFALKLVSNYCYCWPIATFSMPRPATLLTRSRSPRPVLGL